ncbi:MAG: radical SAM/SPASM domain-containing protein [archaeon]
MKKIIKYFKKNELFSVTYFLTRKCNSKCMICNLWKQKGDVNKLNFMEWKRAFSSIGEIPWVTFTGGEPLLKKDFLKIFEECIKIQNPDVITIPTNGINTKLIKTKIENILNSNNKTKIYVNVSLDGLEEKNNYIRGTKFDYKNTIKTLESLSILKDQNNNLKLGINTVILDENIDEVLKLKGKINSEFNIDNHLFEVAQNRVELNNLETSLIKKNQKLINLLEILKRESKKSFFSMKDPIRDSFRYKYYNLLIKHLLGENIKSECLAGRKHVQIQNNGDVISCGNRGLVLGNLREERYNFWKILNSKRAENIRKKISNCYCFSSQSNYFRR